MEEVSFFFVVSFGFVHATEEMLVDVTVKWRTTFRGQKICFQASSEAARSDWCKRMD
jgi:hypothetical protein